MLSGSRRKAGSEGAGEKTMWYGTGSSNVAPGPPRKLREDAAALAMEGVSGRGSHLGFTGTGGEAVEAG